MGLLLLLWACAAAAGTAVGFGIDPDLQIDIITELDLVNTTLGVTQVSGLHNASKAFLFQDTEREIHAAPHVSEKLVQLFRNKSEFTFLATLQQKASTSGVILSIRELEHSYFELESSGLRDEIRFHYGFSGKARTEVFPYRLADGQWHKVAMSLSASHLLLHVDCNRCCNHHDRCYDTCGNKKNDCDEQFQTCLSKICRDVQKTLGISESVQACESTVQLLFDAVIHLGCKPYLDSQRAACMCRYEGKTDL